MISIGGALAGSADFSARESSSAEYLRPFTATSLAPTEMPIVNAGEPGQQSTTDPSAATSIPSDCVAFSMLGSSSTYMLGSSFAIRRQPAAAKASTGANGVLAS